jgi:uncharacterized phosphosugar-binding protein
MLDLVDNVEKNLQPISEVADEVANRLVNGGSLYSTEDGGGFVSELGGRAGGIMMLKRLQDAAEIRQGDAVLATTLDLEREEQGKLLWDLIEKGVLVVLFGSEESPLKAKVNRLIPTFMPVGTAPQVQICGAEEPICPGATVADITAGWAFAGELIAACTRLGKMPTMYQSVYIPNSKVWNPKYSGQAFHDDFDIAPLAPTAVGRTYLADIRRCFEGIRNTQLSLFEQAGQFGAEALKAGNKVWYFYNGHHLHDQVGLPGDPGLLTEGDRDNPTVATGDVYFWVGYYDRPDPQLEIVEKAGCKAVWITGARSVNPIPLAADRIVIDPYWGFGDASVAIPGYDIRILPPSGVVQTACLWMVVGEMAKALAK